MERQAILIAGGYGVVGRRIAAGLAPDYPGRVILAGRDAARAEAAAAAIGHGARGRAIDISVSSSVDATLADVAVIISCIDQPDRTLLRAAIAYGLGYTDITPHLTELGRGRAYEEIASAARASGARLVLGTGIVPGISSVMVRALSDQLGGASGIETALLLDGRDISGPASFSYFLKELAMSFAIRQGGRDHPVRAFSAPRIIDYPSPVGRRPSYLFPLSDQVLYPRTLNAKNVLTRLAIEPGWLAQLLAFASASRLARLLATDTVSGAFAALRRHRASREGALFALRVEVTHGGASRHAVLLGRTQANGAAAGAEAVARALIEDEVKAPGAWMPEQVIASAAFFARIAARGFVVDFPVNAFSQAARGPAARSPAPEPVEQP